MVKKKKVGIVTWVHSGIPNYGQTLQAYAMQQLIYDLGHEPITLSWRWKDKKDSLKHYFSNKYLNYLYEAWYHFHDRSEFRIRSLRFDFFIHRYIKLTSHCYTFSQIKKEMSDCDVLLAGSDQVWNPYLYQPLYYLVFASENQKRISYAPSLAVHSDEGCEAALICMGKLIDRFDKVSVREESSVQLLSKYSKKEIVCVIDPTLLLSRDKWLKFVKKKLIKGSYIFCLIFGPLDPHLKKIESLNSQYNSDKVVYVTFGKDQKISMGRIKNTVALKNVSPQDFLSLIYYADAVITNSFHCVNFSMKFERDFYAVQRFDKLDFLQDDNRMTQLLKSVDLPNRDISFIDSVQKLHINYNEVNEKINSLRMESKKFIEEALR